MFKKISIFVFAALILLCGCKTELSDYFFDEDVLKYYNISGLEKPENVENESWSSKIITSYVHYYCCDIDSLDEFTAYAKKVFEWFENSDCNFARKVKFKTDTSNFEYIAWNETEISDNFEDYSEHFKNGSYERYTYSFFYSVKGYKRAKATPDKSVKAKIMKKPFQLNLFYKPNDPSPNTCLSVYPLTEETVYVLNA